MKSVKKIIKRLACEILGTERVSFRKDLRQVGLESISFAELVARTEDEYGIELFGDEIARFQNLKSFAVYVESKTNDDKRHL